MMMIWLRGAPPKLTAARRKLTAATSTFAAGLLVLVGSVGLAVPANAQDSTSQEIRLRKLEAEVRALQRQVFPGPGGQDAAPVTSSQAMIQPGSPATSPVTDLLTRVDALEAQNARLTAQNEEIGNRLRQMEGKLSAVAPVAANTSPSMANSPDALPPPRPTALIGDRGLPREGASGDVATMGPASPTPRAALPARPSAGRLAAVKAIVKPATGDAGEDDYTYGYKLWQAKFYPEAEQQLKLFVDKYPHHPRVSYARNLLGRAFYDDGHPREAAPWFLQNYQANKHGERAADSLLYLADSMVAVKDTNRACIALAEFADTYPGEAAGRLKAAYGEARQSVACN